MPTKTKPVKEWVMSFVHNIHLSDERRMEVAKLLGLDTEAAAPFIAEIEQVLKFGTARVHARETEPLPAHLLEELRPAADLAKKMADTIANLSGTARVMPGLNLAGELWHAATEFHSNASIVCDGLKEQGRRYQRARKTGSEDVPTGGSDGGARKANVRSARDGVQEVLAGIYDRAALQPTIRGRNAFLREVTGKLKRG